MTKSNQAGRAAVYILSFAVPAAVLLSVYAAMGMFPWGDKTVLITDMSDQYVEFFCALKSGDIFFSWSKALGTSYIGVFSFYMSSPLSFLTLPVPNEYMPVALMFLTVLKLGLAGLSYAVYSVRRFPDAEIATVLCASCYGLMSYNIALSMSIMWLDGVIWLPLILLALERILAGRGAGPFIAALTVCFLSTWYISYMIGIFCCVYLAVRLVGLMPDRAALLRVLGRFFGGAVCALGLTAWLWLPTFLAMFSGKFQGNGWEPSGIVYGPLSDVFGQLRPGQLTSITYNGPPNIFCGTVVAALAVIWFFLRTVPLREKLAGAGALAVLFLSLWLTKLDRVWHLFQYPNWFPFRYSFVVSFFLIYLANQALPGLREGLEGKVLVRSLAAALLLFTAAELHYNTKTLLAVLDGQFHYQSYETYRSYYAANAALVDKAESDSGGGFFRINTTSDRGHNAPLSFGYPGITHYSSLYNQKLNNLLRDLGLAQAWYWCSGYGSTPVTDALFDIRYVISRDELPYEAVAQSGGYTLYENPNVLPIAFLSAGEDAPVLSAAATPFERQNDLLSALTGGTVAAFTPLSAEVSGAGTQVSFTFTGTGRAVYADLSAGGLRQVLVNGERVLALGSSEAASVHYLGTPEAGEVWTVTVQHRGSWRAPGPFLWELDSTEPWESRWPAVAGAVRAIDQAEVLEVKQNGAVRLSVTADSPRQLLTTVPAEDGWRAYVDGERVDTVVWLDAFLSLDIPAGTHRVELRYTAPGLMPGLTLGIISAAGACLFLFLGRKRSLTGGTEKELETVTTAGGTAKLPPGSGNDAENTQIREKGSAPMSHSFFAYMFRMRYIARWALMRNTRTENVEEHSYEVAVLAHALAAIGREVFRKDVDPDKAATAALFHDAPEIITGDMPTPIKYYNPDIKTAYRQVEAVAQDRLLSMLPPELAAVYEPLVRESDENVRRYVKAADKLSAYIKCVEERKAGNSEFKMAAGQTLAALKEMDMEELDWFMERFLPAFELTLDELQ